MSVTLELKEFRKHLKGTSIAVARVKADTRLVGLGLEQADLNRDGMIARDAELNALFRLIEKVDRDKRSGLQVRDRSGKANRVSDLIQAVGELAGVNILQKMAQDDILLVGLNEVSKHEAAALRKRGNGVVYVQDEGNDTISIDGTKYDLTDASDLTSFVATLGLPKDQSAAIAAAIRSGGYDIKDELARIAWVWADAEKGRGIPARLILSGHGVGTSIFGTGNGSLQRATLASLAAAMPRAAAQIEDLHLAACYCGGQALVLEWAKIFPRVKTVWAYSGSAPTEGGAVAHLRVWDRATRGDQEKINPRVVANAGKGYHVAIWSRIHGYLDESDLLPVATLRSNLAAGEPLFQAYLSGDRTVGNPHRGELRDYYNNVQALLGHPDSSAAERPAVEKKRDVTIRLLYYDTAIRTGFAKNRADLIAAGYKALGMPPPNFGVLSRKAALEAIRKFSAAMSGRSGMADAEKLRPHLESGLRDLLASHIPETWI
jgi:hypothetical protein